MATAAFDSTPVDMDIENETSPTESSFLNSLKEPWKSIAAKAVPPATDDNLSPASVRLEQLEIESRKHMFQLLKDSETVSAKIIGDSWKVFLNLCFHLAHFSSNNNNKDARYSDMEARKLPLVLLEDCLDGLTFTQCKSLWTEYVEPSLDVILGDLFWNASKICHLQFLRVCNQFLSRASTNMEWKGRIMMALAKAFSIADRSALKMWGHFHAANLNEFETVEEFEASSESTHNYADYSLYKAFWSLQTDFSNPNRIQVADFIKKMRTVLASLESASTSKERGKQSIPVYDSSRYLTSSTLFLTQLDTVEFRTSVISQFLIIASHLSSESPSLANALSQLLLRARKLLQTDNPQLYSILWDSILSNTEVQWRRWKKEKKCAASAFAPKRKPTVDDGDQPKQKRSRLPDGFGGDDRGSDQYQLLEKDELMDISKSLGNAAPSLEDHLQDYADALDPEAGIEDEYHPKSDSLFTWRAMRLFAKHQLPLFKDCSRPEDLERMARTWYKDQGKEIPGEMPPPYIDSDDESTSSSESSASGKSSVGDKKDAPTNEDGEKEREDMVVYDDEDPREDKDAEMKDAENEKSTEAEKTKDKGQDEEASTVKTGNLSDKPKEERKAESDEKVAIAKESDEHVDEIKGGDGQEDKEESTKKEGSAKSENAIAVKTPDEENRRKDDANSVKSENSVEKEEDSKPAAVVKVDADDLDGKGEESEAVKKEALDLAKKEPSQSNPPSRRASDDEDNLKVETKGKKVKSRSNSRDRGRSSHKSRDNGNNNRNRDRSSHKGRGDDRGRNDDRRNGKRDDQSRGPRGDDRGPRGGGWQDGPRGGGGGPRDRDGDRRDNRRGDHRGGGRPDRHDDRETPRGGGGGGGRPDRHDDRETPRGGGGGGGPRGGGDRRFADTRGSPPRSRGGRYRGRR